MQGNFTYAGRQPHKAATSTGGPRPASPSGNTWVRSDDMPKIEVCLVPGTASPGGMGEVSYPATAPAVANAIFAAAGKRVRRLPILPADPAGAVPTTVPTSGAASVPTAPPPSPGGRVFVPRAERS